jgi:hypothetical protein
VDLSGGGFQLIESLAHFREFGGMGRIAREIVHLSGILR